MGDLTTALRSGRFLLMDGAMGTELRRTGITEDACLEICNLTHFDRVQAIHRSYVAAGAEILVANTFQANRPALARNHQEHQLTAVITAGLLAARGALTHPGWVLASIGPVPSPSVEALLPLLAACSGADGILLETFSDPEEAAVFVSAIAAARLSKMPILLSFTFDGATLRTFEDAPPEACARLANDLGAAALGVNCGRELDMAGCAGVLERYRAITGLPLFARPNAGTPSSDKTYPRTPESMAAALPNLIRSGAIMVGGCCGTTPLHIRAMNEALRNQNSTASL